MKKLFKNSLIALLLVGLTAGCQIKVDSKETTTENTQVVTSESNTSDTKSKTSKVKLKEDKLKETSNKVETSNKTKVSQASAKEEKQTSEVISETSKEVKQTSETTVKETEVKETTQETTKETEVKQTSQTTTVAKKSLEEIVNDVLNGKYGNGEERYSRLEAEGYNYDEVQAEINKRYTPAKQQSQTQAQQQDNASQSSTSIVDQMPLNSLYINGYIFPIIAGHTQYVIDTAGHRIVNWYGDTTGPKYVGGSVRYFALHNIPYGQAVYNASQVTLKDYNGNVKTYNLQWVSGIIADGTPADAYQTAFMDGNGGDQVVIQTCIDYAANYRYWVFG